MKTLGKMEALKEMKALEGWSESEICPKEQMSVQTRLRGLELAAFIQSCITKQWAERGSYFFFSSSSSLHCQQKNCNQCSDRG